MSNDQSPSRDNETSALDQRLEAEIEAALGDMSLDDMLVDESPSRLNQPTVDRPVPPRERDSSGESAPRQKRVGTIVALHGGNAMVEFDPKTQGMCPREYFDEPPALGAEMEFNLDRYDDNEGLYLLSRRGAVQKAEWESLEVGQLVEARCTGTNKGGLEMEVANHRAFMPAGQVDLRHVPDLGVFVGEKMPCEVMEIDRSRARIILSRKSHLAAERAKSRDELLGELEVGETRSAVITNIKPFGAFADLGGIDGLIHVSDLSHERVKDPESVVNLGDQVEVRVLKIEGTGDDTRISLGMKQLQQDPYEAGLQQIEEGGTVSGRVTKLMAFGAFVEIAPGVEGLIHISELSHDRINRVSQVVKPDEVVTVKILSVDADSRRISLSLKALTDAPEQQEAKLNRHEDPHMRKMKAMLGEKFGDNLKGGLG